MTKTNQLHYFAGLLDGEGCICIKRTGITQSAQARRVKSPSYIFSLTIEMADPRPIDAFCEFFGINRTWSSSRLKTRPHHRTMHVAHVGGRRGIEILRQLTPYLKAKKEEAKLASTFYRTCVAPYNHRACGFNRRPVPDNILERRHAYYLKLQELKNRRWD